MHRDSGIVLSTAPKWQHPTPNNMQWRDHWMQSVYFLPYKLTLAKNEKFVLQVSYNFLFIIKIFKCFKIIIVVRCFKLVKVLTRIRKKDCIKYMLLNQQYILYS